MADINKIRNNADYRRGHWKEDKPELKVVKHPDFDKIYPTVHRLIFWLAKRLATRYGGDKEDYVGTLVLRLNRILYTFNQDKGRITTYLCWGIVEDIFRNFLRFESECRAINWMASNSSDESIKQTNVNYAFHESANTLYKVPDADLDWAQDIIDNFESSQNCWDFFTRDLDGRRAFILRERFAHGTTLEELGRRLKLTKERVRQLQESALKSIRQRLIKLEDFLRLFAQDTP